MLLLAREYFGKTKTTLRGNGIGVTHMSGVFFVRQEGSNPQFFLLIARRQISHTPSGMEKKRDPTAEGTDLNPAGIWNQLWKDRHDAGYIRQYCQVLLQAQPDHSSSGLGACASPAQAHRSLPTVQRRT